MPFSKEEITLEVKEENSFLEWEFETKARDIDFSLVFRGESPEDLEFVVLIPKQRIDTSDEPEKGCFKCEKSGNFNLFLSVELVLSGTPNIITLQLITIARLHHTTPCNIVRYSLCWVVY
ncbi:hypothetical protein HNY73_003532 [Argiope bruennichi]|uniref:GOLD domain-containing protein n=1 Tax=Argiope bruennichi TaxID=94029 RepID=A0A8T0FT50_ARGBR|nr:hypothetical protein HNY73_003532 [Argiope bruennichi]